MKLVPRDGIEKSYKDDIELFCWDKVQWVDYQRRNAAKMIQGGRNLNGNLAYICQTNLLFFNVQQVLPGQFENNSNCCKVVFHGKQHCITTFKVLQTI